MISVLLVQLIAKGNISIHTTWDIALVRARMTYKMCFYSVMISVLQVNLDMTDSMGPGKLVRHKQNLSYTYDEDLICIGLGPSTSSVICKNPSYSGPSYPSSPVLVQQIVKGNISIHTTWDIAIVGAKMTYKMCC